MICFHFFFFFNCPTASNDFQQRVNGLISSLSSKLDQASEGGQASKLIKNALKLVNTASFVGPASEAAQSALTHAEKIVPQVEKLLSNGPASRNSAVTMIAGLVGQRSGLLGEVLAKFAKNMEASGNQPLAAIFKTAAETFQQQVLTNDNARNMANKVADGIDMVEDAINLLNNMSGGMIPQLNTLAGAINTLDDASDTLLSREKDDDSKNLIVSKVLGVLYKMKDSNNQFAFDAINKVCDKLHSSQAKNSA